MVVRDERTSPTVLTQGPVNRMKRRGIRTITSSRLSVRDQAIAAMSLSNAGLSLFWGGSDEEAIYDLQFAYIPWFQAGQELRIYTGNSRGHLPRGSGAKLLPSSATSVATRVFSAAHQMLLLCAPMGRLNVGAVPLNCFCTDSYALHFDPRHPKPYMNTALQTCAT